MNVPRRVRARVERYFGDPAALGDREREFSAFVRRLEGECAAPRVPAGELAWPVTGRVTSAFGDRFGRFHAGIDIGARAGTPVHAAWPGRVLAARAFPEYGNTVVIGHGNGFSTVYAHHRDLIVSAGDEVVKGQTIGRVGATGRATGPHLHFETRLAGAPCDPVAVLPGEGDPAAVLRAEILESSRSVLEGVRDVVLVGSPLHPNAGDSLIWLGQVSLLAELGIRVRAVVNPSSYDRRPFDESPADTAVVLSGGGNFGDLWPYVQRHREWVVREIRDRRVVQLPQSMHFERSAGASEMQRALARHPDTVLAWRDHASLAAARELFPTTRSILVPDVAFARRPPAAAPGHETPILCIARRDQEGGELWNAAVPGARRADWCIEAMAPRRARDAIWLASRLDRHLPWSATSRARRVLYNRYALLTVAGATRLVAGSRVVVSDRLHAHVLSTMLGVAHVMLDSGYGKIASFLETWPVSAARPQLASSPADAMRRARRLLDGTSSE